MPGGVPLEGVLGWEGVGRGFGSGNSRGLQRGGCGFPGCAVLERTMVTGGRGGGRHRMDQAGRRMERGVFL